MVNKKSKLHTVIFHFSLNLTIHLKVQVVYKSWLIFYLVTKWFSLFEPCCPRQCISTTYIYYVSIDFASATDHQLQNKNCLSMASQRKKTLPVWSNNWKYFYFTKLIRNSMSLATSLFGSSSLVINQIESGNFTFYMVTLRNQSKWIYLVNENVFWHLWF